MSNVVDWSKRRKDGRIECPTCEGTGTDEARDFEDCETCNGEGAVVERDQCLGN